LRCRNARSPLTSRVRAITTTDQEALGIGWSPDGSGIVYAQQGHGLYVVPAGGGAPRALSTDSAYDPTFSPDGDRIAFVDGSEIATVRPDGSDERLLTANAFRDRYPAWSPDGTQLVEARSDPEEKTGSLFVLAADGSGERRVQQESPIMGIQLLEPFWAPGASAILYVADLLDNDRELYSMRPDGTGLRQLTRDDYDADEADPAVSPDGRWLAFDRLVLDHTPLKNPRRFEPDLYLMRPDGTGLRRLTNTPNVAETEPAWSPDGTRLALVRTGAAGPSRLVVLDIARRVERPLTTPETAVRRPSWSLDGSWIAFGTEDENGRPQIDAVRPDGRSSHTVESASADSTGALHGATAPAWSPHGPLLAYLAGVSPDGLWNWSLAVADPSSGDKRTLAENIADSRPAWSPDGKSLVYSTGPDLYAVATSGHATPRRLQRASGVSDEAAWPQPCTVVGTSRDDVLTGTPGPDRICGLGGNDTIRGGGGSDTLIGGDDDDTLIGGRGSDLVFGAAGRDVLLGRDGSRDVLDGGPGVDRIRGDRLDVVR
jgi:TolB protein